MKITVCIGSSCHLRGSHKVIKKLEKLRKKHDLEDQIELSGCFCMGTCKEGVNVKVENGAIYSLSPDTVEEFFESEILRRFT